MTNICVEYLCSCRLAWMFSHMLICLRVELEIANANLIQINLDHKLKLLKNTSWPLQVITERMIWMCVYVCYDIGSQPCVFLPWFSVISLLIGIFFLSLSACFPLCVLVFSLFACSLALSVFPPLLFSLKIAMVPVAEQRRPQLFYPVIRNLKLGICAFLFPKHFLPYFCPILANDLSNRPDRATLHSFRQCCSWVLMLGLINISSLSVNKSI